MAKSCNLFLDKGADFDAYIQIVGVNNCPVDVSKFRFACQAHLIMNPRIKVDIRALPDPNRIGIVNLHIPFMTTDTMPNGDQMYDVEMSYKDVCPELNKRFKVLTGKIIVNEQVTTSQ